MYLPLLNMYSENFGFGLEGFIISRTFNNRMKGLYMYTYIYVYMCIYIYVYSAQCIPFF